MKAKHPIKTITNTRPDDKHFMPKTDWSDVAILTAFLLFFFLLCVVIWSK